ncbi:MAG: GTPase domain-containing protein [Deltaproteobacteria bacterium]|nr:GTPase domain-containing protein [Candidatus Tharpella sp.]
MAIFNYKKREISAKIVYYGPALCGKTTNVQHIHQKLNPRQRGELVSLATDADRTLFFDFLPIELENVGGFKTRFQIYTVPGQVYYNSTRKAVLTGVDGVIFVADSQISMEQENLESLNNLIENLKYYNRDVNQIPLILQYNRRDLDNIMTMEELDKLLNHHQLPSFAASAATGNGVLQPLTACCKQVLQDLKRKSLQTEQIASNKPGPSTSPAAPPAGNKSTEPGTQPQNLIENNALTTGNHPPFAVPQTDQPPTEMHSATGKPFKPEIAQVGKARLINPHTITLPLRLSTDADQRNLISVDITFSINDFCRADP